MFRDWSICVILRKARPHAQSFGAVSGFPCRHDNIKSSLFKWHNVSGDSLHGVKL